MSLVTELAARPGVLAAGEYSYRGDRFSYRGQMDDEQARMVSIMCRATTMSVHMQARGWEGMTGADGFYPIEGFAMQGFGWSTVVSGNFGVVLSNEQADYQAAYGLLAG